MRSSIIQHFKFDLEAGSRKRGENSCVALEPAGSAAASRDLFAVIENGGAGDGQTVSFAPNVRKRACEQIGSQYLVREHLVGEGGHVVLLQPGMNGSALVPVQSVTKIG